MTTKQQVAVLKSVVKQLPAHVAMLEERVEVLERERPRVLIGSIQGDTETLTVTVPPTWEDADESTAIA